MADLSTHILSLLDTFKLFYHNPLNRSTRVKLLRTGLTWYTDKNIKFGNPKMGDRTLALTFNGEDDWIQLD